MIDRLTAWGPAAVWAAVLFLLSALPDTAVGIRLSVPSEIAVHVGLYTVLGILLAWAGRKHANAGGRPLGAWTLIFLGALYALTDEWHQAFVPGRTASAGDWIADVVGVMLGYALSSLPARRTAEQEE